MGPGDKAQKRAGTQTQAAATDAAGSTQKRGGQDNTDLIIQRVMGNPEISDDQKDNYEYKHINGTPFIVGKGDANAISPNDVTQGQVGDCWFMSSIIAVAAVDPAAIERLIRPVGHGRYEVTLYTRDDKTKKKTEHIVTVDDTFPVLKQTIQGLDHQSGAPVTFNKGDTGYAHGGDRDAAGRREIWPLLLEKAAAMVRVDTQRSYDALGGGTGIDGMDMLCPDELKPAWRNLHGSSPDGTMMKHPPRLSIAEVTELLVTNHASGHPMTTGGASSTWCGDKPVFQGHVYAIVGIDPAKKTVTLQDPTGATSGVFAIDDYRQVFQYVHVGQPLK